jgi:3-hydroxymyristoyl/3-hydroxydecanoyl-(acyl carrier protein) dehydratase
MYLSHSKYDNMINTEVKNMPYTEVKKIDNTGIIEETTKDVKLLIEDSMFKGPSIGRLVRNPDGNYNRSLFYPILECTTVNGIIFTKFINLCMKNFVITEDQYLIEVPVQNIRHRPIIKCKLVAKLPNRVSIDQGELYC